MSRRRVGGVLFLVCCAAWIWPAFVTAENPADIYVPKNPRLEAMPHDLLTSSYHPNWDTDSDGLPDAWEQTHFGGLTQTAQGDPDGDGMPNIAEYNLGTDPNVDNTESAEVCNAAPTLTVTTSSAGATELEMFGVLARADDPEDEQVRFYIDYSSIGVGDDDEPEFYADPAEPNAHLYWIPGEGRNSGSPYSVTVYACDESDVCTSQSVNVSVLPADAVSVVFENTSSISYVPIATGSPPTVVVPEGSTVTVSDIVVSSTDPNVGMSVTFNPPLSSDSPDFPFITKSTGTSSTKFKIYWLPGRTRAGTTGQQTYAVTVRPYCDDRLSTGALNSFTFNITVTDTPIAVPPTIVVAAGQTLEFDLDVSDWHGGTAYKRFTDQVLPPGATLGAETGHFTWATSTADAGKAYKLFFQSRCGPSSANCTIKNCLYYLRVLPPLNDDDEGNLVMNPDFVHDVTNTSYEAGSDSLVDGWTTTGSYESDNEETDTFYLKWDSVNSELVSANNLDAGNDPTSTFDWRQRVDLWTTPGVPITEGTVYEFSATYHTNDVHLRIMDDGRATSTAGTGLSIGFSTHWSNQVLHSAYWAGLRNFVTGFGGWNNSDGCYHEVDTESGDSAETTYTCYFVPPPNTRYATIYTSNAAPGKLTVSHVSLKPVSADLNVPSFQIQNGSISQLLDDTGQQAFFAITMNSDTPGNYDGNLMPIETMRRLGFNLMSYVSGRAAEHIASGMFAYGDTKATPYTWNLTCDPVANPDPSCQNNTHGGFYPGDEDDDAVSHYYGLDLNKATAQELVSETQNGLRVVILDGPDESNFRIAHDGSPTALAELGFAKTELQSIINRPYLLNMMPRDDYAAIDDPHTSLADVISFTWNLPFAYTRMPTGYYSGTRYSVTDLPRTGEAVRRLKGATARNNNNTPKPILGFGTGVRGWSAYDECIPFHLQRFAAYNQIANGAAGMRFYGISSIDLTLPTTADSLADRYHWSQIQELTAELGLLYEVLEEANYYGDWSFTPAGAPIEAMLKEHDGKLYLIATNASEEPAGNVTFTLPSSLLPNGIGGVTALFESNRTISEYELDTPDDGFLSPADWCAIRQRGATRVNWARTVYAKSGFTTFSDYFGDYAVHVYEIVPPSGMFVDSDEDGLPDNWETAFFGTLDYNGNDDVEAPFGGDGLTNAEEYALGTNPMICDTDGDGLWDGHEVNVLGTLPTSVDTDTDGVNDNVDNCPNSFNSLQEDEDGDGVGDVCDLCLGTAAGMSVTDSGCDDCNTNGVRDGCDIDSGYSTDYDGNGVPDECQAQSEDCNTNGVWDYADVYLGTSQDCDGNEIPDECDIAACSADPACADCNSNGVPDGCELEAATSFDCNGNSIPDECDIAAMTSDDCNTNGIPDECDLYARTDTDCNNNGILDSCDIATAVCTDLNSNGIADVCEDCNTNGVPDDMDISGATSLDCNTNGVPDECDILAARTPLQWATGVEDYSSEFRPEYLRFNAVNVLGEPDVAIPGALNYDAWKPANNDPDAPCPWIIVTYDAPVYASGAVVVETWNPGFVKLIEARDVNDNWYLVWADTDTCSDQLPEYPECVMSWAEMPVLVDALRVTLDANLVVNYPPLIQAQIDAIGLLVSPGGSTDCNTNGIPDDCELAGCVSDPACDDCNTNGVLDECDIASATSTDYNADGIPDACQDQSADCNSNTVWDAEDIYLGTSDDCNTNGIPDECDIADSTSDDCNTNGIPDECELASCAGDPACEDCNSNGILDECDIANCLGSPDCDDCNASGVPDWCEIHGTGGLVLLPDLNQNGVPDVCD